MRREKETEERMPREKEKKKERERERKPLLWFCALKNEALFSQPIAQLSSADFPEASALFYGLC